VPARSLPDTALDALLRLGRPPFAVVLPHVSTLRRAYDTARAPGQSRRGRRRWCSLEWWV
jgi:hypothetical protein